MEEKKKLYLVDDEYLNLSMLERTFSNLNYEITTFEDADSVLKHMGFDEKAGKVTQNIPDAIVTDNNTCSRYNGMFVLKALKDFPIGKALQTADTVSIAEVREAGGENAKLIYKPYGEEKARATLKASMEEAEILKAKQQNAKIETPAETAAPAVAVTSTQIEHKSRNLLDGLKRLFKK